MMELQLMIMTSNFRPFILLVEKGMGKVIVVLQGAAQRFESGLLSQLWLLALMKFLMIYFCEQVHKQGTALGRSVDLAKFNNYDELIAELDGLFDFNGELKARSKSWLVVYTDDEGDMMLVGDDPWQ